MFTTTIGEDLSIAVDILNSGGLVAVPTETVYGLAGSIESEKAISEIYRVKERPSNDPLIVHAHSLDAVFEKLTTQNESRIVRLAEKFWPGPLTLIVKKLPSLSASITSGSEKVGVRIPKHPLLLELLKRVDFPLAAPSANPFGYISPTTSKHVFDQLNTKIPYIVEGGSCVIGIESTILDISTKQPRILREGVILKSELEEVIGTVILENLSLNINSPGRFEKHYSPLKLTTAIKSHQDLRKLKITKSAGIILFNQEIIDHPVENQIILSPGGDLFEAAKNLYSALRHFDQSDVTEIMIQFVPNKNIGLAINDRINRACRN